MKVSDQQKQYFEENGYLIVGPLLTEEELQPLRERIDALASGKDPLSAKARIRFESGMEQAQAGGGDQTNRVWQLLDTTKFDPVIAAHAANPNILDVIEQLMGPDIKLYSDQVLMKPAFHGSPVSWHQDSGYWTPIAPPALISCWTALDHATVDNGCVRYVPGTHKLGVVPHRQGEDSFLHLAGVDVEQAVPAEAPAGWCVFHHSCTVHGSGPNLSPHRRRGLVTTYMRADSKWVGEPDKKVHFPLLRGREYPGCV